jgi:hypothetical protein
MALEFDIDTQRFMETFGRSLLQESLLTIQDPEFMPSLESAVNDVLSTVHIMQVFGYIDPWRAYAELKPKALRVEPTDITIVKVVNTVHQYLLNRANNWES